MKEKLSIPAVGGIIRRIENEQEFILLQDRVKTDYKSTSGIIEIPAGKIRELERQLSGYGSVFLCTVRANEMNIEESSESQNIRWTPVDKLRILLKEHPEQFFSMQVGTLR